MRTHEMDVEGPLEVGPNRADNFWAEGDIGDEVSVHDIQVKPFRAGTMGAGSFMGKPTEIRRQERRCNDHAGCEVRRADTTASTQGVVVGIAA